MVFDYDEFTEEGYEQIDEEIDQSLFEFFVSDYEDESVRTLETFPTSYIDQNFFFAKFNF